MYLLTKTLHLLFVMAWVAAAFYLPRILINIVEDGGNAAVMAELLLAEAGRQQAGVVVTSIGNHLPLPYDVRLRL